MPYTATVTDAALPSLAQSYFSTALLALKMSRQWNIPASVPGQTRASLSLAYLEAMVSTVLAYVRNYKPYHKYLDRMQWR